ncbi:MAG: T9SS type A sorting domain-containing protein, partial [Bacteroidota bacterium]
FNYSNNNGTSSGDQIRTHTLTIPENQVTTGIDEPATSAAAILVYPNPVTDQARVSFSLETPGRVLVRLFDLSGREMIEPIAKIYDSGRQDILVDNLSELKSGVYRLVVASEEKTWTTSLLKR